MRIVSWIIVLCFLCAPVVEASTIEQQRVWFQQAHKALDAQQTDLFATLKGKLADYPLTPYLDIWQARKQIKTGADDKVAATLEKFADIPESHDLRQAWITDLAERGQWPQVAKLLDAHPKLQKNLPEIAMMSDWSAGRTDIALQQYSRHWLNGDSLTEISESLHKTWLKLGHPDRNERLSRIIRLAGNGQWKEINSLSTGRQQQQWLQYWRKLQADPQAVFTHWPSSLTQPASRHVRFSKAMISDGLTRLARKDPLQAHASLQKLKKRVRFAARDSFYDRMGKQIALRAAKQHMQIAAQWLGKLPAGQQDEETRAWLARLYMLQRNWVKMLQIIHTMPRAELQQSRWQYWQAYALQARGESEQANLIFTTLASNRGYYSFLSAERIGQPYNFGSETIDASPTLIQGLDKLPGIKRAYEWLALESYHKANREWDATLAGSSREIWQSAAVMATAWRWPDQAIRAAFRAGKMNALEERFPLHFESDVLLAAKETGLNPASIWGVIRQESLFNRQALSPAGARGLMQLMPKTAKMVAKQMKLHDGHQALFSPAVNIRLGSRYLADMKSRFGDHLALAAAAYNAGPHRVSQWLERTPFETSEIWVEAIPYNETRRYVQHVMAYTTVYEWRRQQQETGLPALTPLTLSLDVSLNEDKN